MIQDYNHAGEVRLPPEYLVLPSGWTLNYPAAYPGPV